MQDEECKIGIEVRIRRFFYPLFFFRVFIAPEQNAMGVGNLNALLIEAAMILKVSGMDHS